MHGQVAVVISAIGPGPCDSFSQQSSSGKCARRSDAHSRGVTFADADSSPRRNCSVRNSLTISGKALLALVTIWAHPSQPISLSFIARSARCFMSTAGVSVGWTSASPWTDYIIWQGHNMMVLLLYRISFCQVYVGHISSPGRLFCPALLTRPQRWCRSTVYDDNSLTLCLTCNFI